MEEKKLNDLMHLDHKDMTDNFATLSEIHIINVCQLLCNIRR
jgi:hypothetical protein